MEELKKDVKIIRESQIRMESDLKYHIKRTDLLEDKINEIEEDIRPLHVVDFFKDNYRFMAFFATLIAGTIALYLKTKGI